MKKLFSYFVVVSVFMVAGSVAGYAQQSFQTFKAPVQQAVVRNKSLQNSILENQKTLLDKEMVQGKLLPTVTANAGYGYLHSGFDLDLPTQQLPLTGLNLFEGSQKGNISTQVGMAGITAKQVIFSGLQITHGKKALEHKARAQELMTEAGYDQLAQEVVLSFDQLMLLKEVDLLIDDSDRRLRKEHQKVVKAIENGLAIPYDRDKIKLAMLELESKKAEVQSNRELLYYKLEELTGLPREELLSVSYVLSEILVNGEETMNRKELQALEASQKAFEYALKKEKGAQLPMLFAFGNVSYVNTFGTDMTLQDIPRIGDVKLSTNHLRMFPGYTVGVGMKWNIFEGKTHKSSIEKARLDLQINANKLDDTREKLSLLQRKTRSDYELAIKKIAVNQQQVNIAKNNMQLASRQFEEGLLDVTERLEAENEYYKHSLNYFNQVLSQRSMATELLKTNGNLYQTIMQ